MDQCPVFCALERQFCKAPEAPRPSCPQLNNPPFTDFFPTKAHPSYSLSSAPWSLLPNKTPAPRPWLRICFQGSLTQDIHLYWHHLCTRSEILGWLDLASSVLSSICVDICMSDPIPSYCDRAFVSSLSPQLQESTPVTWEPADSGYPLFYCGCDHALSISARNEVALELKFCFSRR